MKNNSRIQELDALRGVAALMIVFFHFFLNRFLPFHLDKIRIANTGVELFFIISGFVIFMTLQKVNNSKEFIINRFSRLYPTYWSAVTITFLVSNIILPLNYPHSESADFLAYLANMTMYQHYFHVTDLDGPYWTMIIEMNFYLFMLMLFKLKLLKYAAELGGIFSVMIVIILLNFSNTDLVKRILFFVPSLVYLPLFFSGIVFYELFADEKKNVTRKMIIGVLLICQVLLHPYIRNTGYTSQAEYSVMITFFGIIFTLLISNKLGFIVTKATLFLGKISFSLYLIHQFISVNVIIPALMQRVHMRFFFACIIALCVVIVMSYLISTFIEVPCRKLIKRQFRSEELKRQRMIEIEGT